MPQEKEQRQPIISLRKIHKSFETKTGLHQVLRGVSFDVYSGETLTILGLSGTGKTVTLKLVEGIFAPDSGEVYVFGKNLAEITQTELDEIRKKMAYVFQENALYSHSDVEQNILFALREHTNLEGKVLIEKAIKLLRGVGLIQTDGDYDSIRYKRPYELSGGMKKRVALARALAMDPVVILFDEPTAGLDPVNCQNVYSMIQNLQHSGEYSNLIVTHDVDLALEYSDRIVLVDNGSLVFKGTPKEFTHSPTAIEFLRQRRKTIDDLISNNQSRNNQA